MVSLNNYWTGLKIFSNFGKNSKRDYSSNQCRVLSGVPQGTVLAPLLFICYVNDLATLVNSMIRLYADDILLYRIINTSDDNKLLQDNLDTLLNWSKT